MSGRHISAVAAALATLAGIVGCGSSERVVARVGQHTITSADLSGAISALAPEHVAPEPPRYAACVSRRESFAVQSVHAVLRQECRSEYEQLKQRALGQLIAGQWLLGEARDRGLNATNAASASAKIRQMLARRVSAITDSQVSAYYQTHRQQFLIPEERYFDIHHFSTAAAARKAKAAVEAGGGWAKPGLHESLERPRRVKDDQIVSSVKNAIYAAKLHVLTGPIAVHPYHSLFEITRIVPLRYKPLAAVRGAIERKLTADRQRQILARFVQAWRSKWVARTDCQPGYVVQKCRQYAGRRVAEDPLSLG